MMIKRSMALMAALLLAACAEGPPNTRMPEMTFTDLPPLKVAVAQVEVVNNYSPPMKDPNVEHTFPTPPSVAAEKLIRQQLIATGGASTLRAIIEDASVQRAALPVDKGWKDIFVREPVEKLKGRVLVRFELVSPSAPDIVTGRSDVVATREKTLLEDMSPAARDEARFMMTKDLMYDLDSGMRNGLKNNMGLR